MVSFLKKLFTSSNQTNVETPKKNYNTKQRNRTRDSFNMKVDRNLKGIELEKRGRIEEAIELYEMNVEKGFDGNHPYDRLCVIYRKQGKIADEIRVLEEAISVWKSE